jgi:preprotein translocase subunit SecG
MYEKNEDLIPSFTLTNILWRVTFFVSLLMLLLYIGLNLPA